MTEDLDPFGSRGPAQRDAFSVFAGALQLSSNTSALGAPTFIALIGGVRGGSSPGPSRRAGRDSPSGAAPVLVLRRPRQVGLGTPTKGTTAITSVLVGVSSLSRTEAESAAPGCSHVRPKAEVRYGPRFLPFHRLRSSLCVGTGSCQAVGVGLGPKQKPGSACQCLPFKDSVLSSRVRKLGGRWASVCLHVGP